MNNEFLESNDIVSAFVPVDLQDGANNGDWVNMANAQRCLVLLFSAAGTAGDDPVLTLKQAKDNAGTGAKALNFTRIREKVGTLTSVGQWTLQTQAASNTYTNTASAESEKLIAVEIKAEDLDADNDFTHVQLSVADTGINAQLGAALYLLLGLSHPQEKPNSNL